MEEIFQKLSGLLLFLLTEKISTLASKVIKCVQSKKNYIYIYMKNAMTMYVQAGCMSGTVGNKESFTLKM